MANFSFFAPGAWILGGMWFLFCLRDSPVITPRFFNYINAGSEWSSSVECDDLFLQRLRDNVPCEMSGFIAVQSGAPNGYTI
jgi:hypothetical protein